MEAILATTQEEAVSIIHHFYNNGFRFKNGNKRDSRFNGSPLVYFIKNGIIKYRDHSQYKKEAIPFSDSGIEELRIISEDLIVSKMESMEYSDNLLRINNQGEFKFVYGVAGQLCIFHKSIGHCTFGSYGATLYAGFLSVNDYVPVIALRGSQSILKKPPDPGSLGEEQIINLILQKNNGFTFIDKHYNAYQRI